MTDEEIEPSPSMTYFEYRNVRKDLQSMQGMLLSIRDGIERSKKEKVPFFIKPFLWFMTPALASLYLGLSAEDAVFYGVIPAVAVSVSMIVANVTLLWLDNIFSRTLQNVESAIAALDEAEAKGQVE